MMPTQAIPHVTVVVARLFAALSVALPPAHRTPGTVVAVDAKLSEWKVELSAPTIAPGTVTFTVVNAGSIPHAFEVEGHCIVVRNPGHPPFASATLTLDPGQEPTRCTVRLVLDSHKMFPVWTRT